MKKSFTLLSAAIFMAAAFNSVQSNAQEKMKMTGNPMEMETKATKLKTDMRKLWEDHIVWTRNVIICLVDNTPGTDQAVKRLLKNQDDIGNAIKPFYGEAAGNELTRLLKEHITGAADVVNAAKGTNNSALEEANKKWQENADEISGFLARANPKWSFADLKLMMRDHLTLTTNEALHRINKDYVADVSAYDKVHDEILQMSDMLSYGIISQFPDKFKTDTKK